MTTYKIYSGTNSPFLYSVRDLNGAKYSETLMATLTRVRIKYIPSVGATPENIDSDILAHASVFDWDSFATTGQLKIDLGPLSLTAGRDTSAEIIIYDSVYTYGRPAQIDLYISDEFGSGGIPAWVDVLNITADQVLTTSHLRSSIIVLAEEAIDITLPSMGTDEDGEWLEIMWDGSYAVTVTCADADTIGDAIATVMTLKAGDTYGHILIKYSHAYTGWVVFRSGSISAT